MWKAPLWDNLTPPSPCSRVVLRVMEVPQLPVALEALGTAGEALWAARRVPPRMALLCTARPLSFTWTPDGRGIVAVRQPRQCSVSLLDALRISLACQCKSAAP